MSELGPNLGFGRRSDLEPYPSDRAKAEAMERVAEHYAMELDAQFRTLNHFATQAGEIGRAHETYIRAVLRRFLPSRWRLSTGFVAGARVSAQQDVIVHDHIDHGTLFEVGDCVVVEGDAVGGTIEVKTDLSSADAFRKALARLPRGFPFVGLYAWDAVDLDAALPAFWQALRDTHAQVSYLQPPHYVLVRRKYVLLRTDQRDSPVGVVRLTEGGDFTDGRALLGLVAVLWYEGLVSGRGWEERVPAWLRYWRARFQSAAEAVNVPDDLRGLVR